MRPSIAAGLLALAVVAVMLLLSGCVRGTSDASEPEVAALVPVVTEDFPGWTIAGQIGPTETSLVSGAGAGGLREDVAYRIVSPDGQMELLAWYARSSALPGEGDVAWMQLDELFAHDGWRSVRARSLYAEMKSNRPDESLLGAYPADGDKSEKELWHVGFYTEQVGGGSLKWVRGDHLFSFDASTSTWSLVKLDSGSTNAWNTTGRASR